MNKHVFITLAIAAVLIGASIPLLMSGFLSQGGSATTTTQILEETTPVHNLEGLKRFSSYEELYEYLEKALTANKWFTSLRKDWLSYEIVSPIWGGSGGEAGAQPASKTNVQVEGVDEPDVVKTNGEIVTVASGNRVFIVSVEEKVVKSVIAFEESVKGLLLYKEKLVVFTESYTYYYEGVRVDKNLAMPAGAPELIVYLYNLTNPENPGFLGKISVTGYMLSSRLLDEYVYLVANTYVNGPVIPFVNGEPVPLETLAAVDEQPDVYTVILAIDLEELDYATYTFLIRSGGWLYMSLSNLYIACEKPIWFTDAYNIVLKAIAEHMPPEERDRVLNLLDEGVLDRAYEEVNEYLSSMSEDARQRLLDQVATEVNKEVRSDETTFYVFTVNGLSISLKGSFTIPGLLLDQFAMEETGDFFITATTETNYTIMVGFLPIIYPIYYESREISECSFKNLTGTLYVGWNSGVSENNVFIIELNSLNIVGSLKNLAPGERIYSARLIGNVFFLVTFRQVDPLFAIDVSDPGHPTVIGFLKIPGFSEYLHPLSAERLLGIGIEDGWFKISLFNVTDPVNMSEVFKINLPSTWSQALYDHHAVTIHPEKQLVLIPFTSYGGGGVSSGVIVIKYSSDELRVDAILPHQSCIRTAYVGDELYTISPGLIKVFSLETYEELLQIPLQG
ncbi:beta-propeller domain-containing protein [Thermosphaera sp.]